MADDVNRFIKLLDQALPFLAASPPLLKYWIYILIILNAVTVAGVTIAYLSSKTSRLEKTALTYFSIERPANGESIPLGEDHAWMLEGNFPIASEGGKIDVTVSKLPNRHKIPQTGLVRFSSARGKWLFDSAKFDGPGSYEIVVTAELGKQTDYQLIKVTCLAKAEAYTRAIELDRARRGAPKVVTPSHDIDLREVKRRLYSLQEQFFQEYPGNLDEALKIVFKTFDIIDPVLPVFPNDYELQNFRAYSFKNYAMVSRDLGREDDFKSALGESERMFEAIRQQKPRDASAWNGLGSIALLRNDPKTALQYIDQALKIQPDYDLARQDRDTALRMLNKK
jgi:tetratricopeptide (TPR) repeat protein